MVELFLFLIFFIFVYLIYYLVVISKKNKLDKLVRSTECMYLEKKYQINVQKIPIRSLANHLAITNAFIISLTVFIVYLVNNWLLRFVLGIFILMILILICYHILGKIYQKKYKEEETK